jgi:hypothetical protein
MKDRNEHPAVRDYRLASLVSLAVLALALWSEGFEAWALLPLVPGLLSLLLLSPAGPIFVLVLLALLYGIGARLGLGTLDSSLGGLVIASAIAYVACHWRLISLTKQALPGDRRRTKAPSHARLKGRWLQPEKTPRRNVLQTTGTEWLVLLVQVALFPFLGFATLLLIASEMNESAPQGVSRSAWGLLLIAWGFLGVLAVGYALHTVLRWRSFTPEEAELYLQDQLWSATRAEQRRIQSAILQEQYRAERRGEIE